jgi:hypothetical protein
MMKAPAKKRGPRARGYLVCSKYNESSYSGWERTVFITNKKEAVGCWYVSVACEPKMLHVVLPLVEDGDVDSILPIRSN